MVPRVRRFDPVAARGRRLVTLQEAGNFITKLPKAEHEAAAEWQATMEARSKVGALSWRAQQGELYEGSRSAP
jgi:hypothetical protein